MNMVFVLLGERCVGVCVCVCVCVGEGDTFEDLLERQLRLHSHDQVRGTAHVALFLSHFSIRFPVEGDRISESKFARQTTPFSTARGGNSQISWPARRSKVIQEAGKGSNKASA